MVFQNGGYKSFCSPLHLVHLFPLCGWNKPEQISHDKGVTSQNTVSPYRGLLSIEAKCSSPVCTSCCLTICPSWFVIVSTYAQASSLYFLVFTWVRILCRFNLMVSLGNVYTFRWSCGKTEQLFGTLMSFKDHGCALSLILKRDTGSIPWRQKANRHPHTCSFFLPFSSSLSVSHKCTHCLLYLYTTVHSLSFLSP